MLKIAIIEDSFVFRRGVKCILEKIYPDVVFIETDHNSKYDDTIIRCKPNLIIVGVSPKNYWYAMERIKMVKRVLRNVPVVIYDHRADRDSAIKYFRASVNGYLARSDGEDELRICLNAVFSGQNYVCPVVRDSLLKDILASKPILKTVRQLSMREFEVGILLSEGSRTSEIANRLGLKSSTVSTVKSKIYSKLGVSNAIELREKISI